MFKKSTLALAVVASFAFAGTAEAKGKHGHHHTRHGHHHGHMCRWRDIKIGGHWAAQNKCVGPWHTVRSY